MLLPGRFEDTTTKHSIGVTFNSINDAFEIKASVSFIPPIQYLSFAKRVSAWICLPDFSNGEGQSEPSSEEVVNIGPQVQTTYRMALTRASSCRRLLQEGTLSFLDLTLLGKAFTALECSFKQGSVAALNG